MVLDNGTTIGIIIALLAMMTVTGLFWKENIRLTKQVRFLQVTLRDEKRKSNG